VNEQQTEALRMYTEGREGRLRECALRIQEHIGYVIDRIDRDSSESVDHYLNGIAMDTIEARMLVSELCGIKTGASFASEPVAREA
jgi:hypothetical protein